MIYVYIYTHVIQRARERVFYIIQATATSVSWLSNQICYDERVEYHVILSLECNWINFS